MLETRQPGSLFSVNQSPSDPMVGKMAPDERGVIEVCAWNARP